MQLSRTLADTLAYLQTSSRTCYLRTNRERWWCFNTNDDILSVPQKKLSNKVEFDHICPWSHVCSKLWPPYGIGQAIIFLSCGFFFYLLSFFLFLFLAPTQIGCLPYFDTWRGPSVNVGCRSDRLKHAARTWLAGNAGRKKSPKNRHLHTITELCLAISLQLRHVLTIGKKTC